MTESRMVDEDQKYLKFNMDGRAELITGEEFDEDFSYRKVHYTHEDEWKSGFIFKNSFKDPEYQIDAEELPYLDLKKKNVVLKRLYDLYRHFPRNERPHFFPDTNYNFQKLKNHS